MHIVHLLRQVHTHKNIISAITDAGIGNRITEIANQSTATSIVLITANGERHFAYYSGANQYLNKNHILPLLDEHPKILHISSALALKELDSELKELFVAAKDKKIVTSMDVTNDASGQWLKKIDEALYHIDIFMPSLVEAIAISSYSKLEDIVDFFSKYPIKILIIKLGAEGCFVKTQDRQFTLKPVSVDKVVDTTGAGDNFVAGFMAGLLRGLSVFNAVVLGSTAAGFCMSKTGAAPGFKNWEELISFGEKYFEVQ